MTAAAPDQPAIRIHPLLHWLLSGLAAAVAVLVASPALPEWWRLGIGCANAMLVLLVARSQPRETAAKAEARASRENAAAAADVRQVARGPASRPSVGPMARRPPKRLRAKLSGWCLLVVCLVMCCGCLSLLTPRPSPSVEGIALACPVGKVCGDVEAPGVPTGECADLDNAHIGLAVSSMASSALAGGAVAAIPLLDGREDAVLGVSISGAVLALAAGIFGFADAMVVSRFVQWCGTVPDLP